MTWLRQDTETNPTRMFQSPTVGKQACGTRMCTFVSWQEQWKPVIRARYDTWNVMIQFTLTHPWRYTRKLQFTHSTQGGSGGRLHAPLPSDDPSAASPGSERRHGSSELHPLATTRHTPSLTRTRPPRPLRPYTNRRTRTVADSRRQAGRASRYTSSRRLSVFCGPPGAEDHRGPRTAGAGTEGRPADHPWPGVGSAQAARQCGTHSDRWCIMLSTEADAAAAGHITPSNTQDHQWPRPFRRKFAAGSSHKPSLPSMPSARNQTPSDTPARSDFDS